MHVTSPHPDTGAATRNGAEPDLAKDRRPVYASRDWHPPVTRHFQPYGGDWPPHCVQNSNGANFHEDLRLPPSAIVISKGQTPDSPGYSAFEGYTPCGRTFLSDLQERQIDHLYVGGLATDYCVKHSVLDARRIGLEVTVLGDAIAGVEVQPGDSARAIAEMRAAGAEVTTSRTFRVAASPRPRF